MGKITVRNAAGDVISGKGAAPAPRNKFGFTAGDMTYGNKPSGGPQGMKLPVPAPRAQPHPLAKRPR